VKLDSKKIKDALAEGKCITRKPWKVYKYHKVFWVDKILHWETKGGSRTFIPFPEDKIAEDWEILG
jgi:hypothetical protein